MKPSDITEEEIHDFSNKLVEFGNGLSDRQRGLLGMLIVQSARGDAGDEDVEGHLMLDPSLHFQLTHMLVDWQIVTHQMHALVQQALTLNAHVQSGDLNTPHVPSPFRPTS